MTPILGGGRFGISRGGQEKESNFEVRISNSNFN